ncbi:MAG: L-sorbosone dehydrogenase [Bacteroidetes bacterium]|nr:MAG: L-sorbosone dehydrogenase [Bacteroidota bacterium]
MKTSLNIFSFSFLMLALSCSHEIHTGLSSGSSTTAGYQDDSLAEPYATKSVQNFSKVVGWKANEAPTAPKGFEVSKFAEGLSHPRWIYVADNGDIFVAESNTILKGIKKIGAKLSKKISTQHVGESANRIILFRDRNKDGIPESNNVFAEGLNQPFGMLIIGNHFYVGNTDGILEYDYRTGETTLKGEGKKIISLPAGEYNRHWARNIITNDAKDKIYIGVGSGTNIAEKGLANEIRRADILEINTDGSGEKIYASGLRNPVGMAWAPGTNTLWAAVNERDELGDELVPDYLTSVKPGAFYGWPFFYYGNHPDPRMKDNPVPDSLKNVTVPDIPLGSHTASLGLVFYEKNAFPQKYHGGAFVTQHGSWNRTVLSGYKVIFVPFKDGKQFGKPEDFLTGFISNLPKSEVHGRPVGIAVLSNGSMLISDDVSNTIWKVTPVK